MAKTELAMEIRSMRRAIRDMRRYYNNAESWFARGNRFSDYEEFFREVLGEVNLREFMSTRPSPVVIDLMSPSDVIRDLFIHLPPDKSRLGVAVSLADDRSAYFKKLDKRLGIIQIAGDLTRSSTWGELERNLKGRKADLIIERGLAGLSFIPVNRELYTTVACQLYALLSEDGGTLVAQVHDSSMLAAHNIPILEWVQALRSRGVDVHYAQPFYGSQGAIKIIKTPSSPPSIAGLLV